MQCRHFFLVILALCLMACGVEHWVTLGWVTADPRQAAALEQNSSAEMGTEQNGSTVKQSKNNCLLLSGNGDGAEQLHGSVVAKDR